MERGEPGAWEKYLRAAELAMRPDEEWELERAKPQKGERLYVRGTISYQAVAALGSLRESQVFCARIIEKAVQQLVAAGASRWSVEMYQTHSIHTNELEFVVHGVIE